MRQTPLAITLLDPLPEAARARIAAHLPPGATLHVAQGRTRDAQEEAISRAPFAITGDMPVSRALLEHGVASGLVGIHKWGVGYDSIDLEAARALGVRVLRTTGSNAVPVAETTIGLMLALLRNIVAGHVGLAEGRWLKPSLAPRCGLLAGRTVGLIGFGAIGQEVARRLAGFDCAILYAARRRADAAIEAGSGARFVDRATLLAQADIVSLHCALTPQTAMMLDGRAIAGMKPGALLVNTARGGLVDEAALAAAVRAGHLGGAAFDVFAEEPMPPASPLADMRDILKTPHIGGTAVEIFGETIRRMAANLAAIATGSPPAAGDVLV